MGFQTVLSIIRFITIYFDIFETFVEPSFKFPTCSPHTCTVAVSEFQFVHKVRLYYICPLVLCISTVIWFETSLWYLFLLKAFVIYLTPLCLLKKVMFSICNFFVSTFAL
jgi:hypothetical protein